MNNKRFVFNNNIIDDIIANIDDSFNSFSIQTNNRTTEFLYSIPLLNIKIFHLITYVSHNGIDLDYL